MWYNANTTNISHDAKTGMFEANVTLEKDDVVTGHVVQVAGPISTPFQTLRPALIQAAIAKRVRGQFEFRQVKREGPIEKLHNEILSRQTLLDDLLRRAA